MKFRFAAVCIFLLTFLTPCLAHHMAVIINKDNNVSNVTATHLAKIFRSEIKKWPNGTGIVLILHKDSAGEMETLEHLNKMSANEWKALLAAHK
ncbi:MAG: substrate-binding domain-containing protein, partial [Candidatus Sulfotelmatobacter sp.]